MVPFIEITSLEETSEAKALVEVPATARVPENLSVPSVLISKSVASVPIKKVYSAPIVSVVIEGRVTAPSASLISIIRPT